MTLVLQLSSRGITSHLLPLLLSCPVEDIKGQKPGDPDRGPDKAGGSRRRRRRGLPLCGENGTLPQPIQELLAVLHQEGPSTEGIFRRAASGTALRELREALDGGVDLDLGSQPVLLLAVILKVSASGLQLEELLAGLECSEAHLEPLALQDFLRSIPSKLLVTNLYAEWMTAMERTSKQEKGGRQVACSKSPRPQAAAVPAPAYRPQRVHQQDELQQSGHLRWGKAAEPSQRGPAPAGAAAGGD
ncbi:T-cell activation Rho GTPase-activating protein-like [Aquila chrysaetos chrysaetos]|uniref:T-cell activation Rho GTPase-activating protein-like n=1 Tax=Aquila chrysaetos chrysaetos TaxID=223781 RepID=UPI001176A956|nr:T-cell activation Rho GTPase-activating protein-like [Aquila chrysaetos chrysaetos]